MGTRSIKQTRAQGAGLDEVAVAGAHRVAVDALGHDPLAATPFQRLVDAEQERSGRDEGSHQQPPQHPADSQSGPRGAAEHTMIAVKLPHLGAASHTQGGGHRALCGGEDRPHQQHLRVAPDAGREQRREAPQEGYHRGR
jgi:hypothetical protein